MNNEIIQLSAVQHYLFCPRQCGLIHIEQLWEENYFTTIGHQIHDVVHNATSEKRKNIVKSYGLYVSSEKYGLSGQCDLLEFYSVQKDEGAIKLPNCSGYWFPFPVEYKKGKPKKNNCDRVQLCAQTLCLEEMLNCSINRGALYYGEKHHRVDVFLDDDLRSETIGVIESVHKLFKGGVTPKPKYSSKCRNCSLYNICQPKYYEHRRRADYIDAIFE